MDMASALDETPLQITHQDRLEAARVLGAHGIPHIVWAEDALHTALEIPIAITETLALLISEQDVQSSAKIICDSLGYSRENANFQQLSGENIPSHYIFEDNHSVLLSQFHKSTAPRFIILTRDSYANFDVRDNNSIRTFDNPSVLGVRFPTLISMLRANLTTSLQSRNQQTRVVRVKDELIAPTEFYTKQLLTYHLPNESDSEDEEMNGDQDEFDEDWSGEAMKLASNFDDDIREYLLSLLGLDMARDE